VETIEAMIEKLRKAILDADWLVPRKQVVIADLATDRFISIPCLRSCGSVWVRGREMCGWSG
jgi:hypothetical protein